MIQTPESPNETKPSEGIDVRSIPISVNQPTKPHLSMQWVLVDGRLSCRWVSNPD